MKNQDDKFKTITLSWLNSATDDLRWAQGTYQDKFYARSCFVCQQTAEKALKAYLFFRHEKLVKTHNLELLLRQCQKFDNTLSVLFDACNMLTYYYTDARYPDDIYFGDFDNRKTAAEAIKLARQVLDFVRGKIVF